MSSKPSSKRAAAAATALAVVPSTAAPTLTRVPPHLPCPLGPPHARAGLAHLHVCAAPPAAARAAQVHPGPPGRHLQVRPPTPRAQRWRWGACSCAPALLRVCSTAARAAWVLASAGVCALGRLGLWAAATHAQHPPHHPHCCTALPPRRSHRGRCCRRRKHTTMPLPCRVSARDSGKTPLEAVLGEIVVTAEKLTWLLKEGERTLQPSRRGAGVMVSPRCLAGCWAVAAVLSAQSDPACMHADSSACLSCQIA